MSSVKSRISPEVLSRAEDGTMAGLFDEIFLAASVAHESEMDRVEELVDTLMKRNCSVRAILIAGSFGKYVGTVVPTPATA
jgi:hypothetical protein